jgi:hypothetical protein
MAMVLVIGLAGREWDPHGAGKPLVGQPFPIRGRHPGREVDAALRDGGSLLEEVVSRTAT